MNYSASNEDQQKIYKDKRLIELILPVNEIAHAAQKEKTIRHGHISLMHLWWSRKPLVIARAVILASMIRISDHQDINSPTITNILNDILNVIKWENNQQIGSVFY